jgi:8-oxo-dGTP diphosphatase
MAGNNSIDVAKGGMDHGFVEPATVHKVLEGNLSGITTNRPRVIVDVNLILVRGNEILLGRRRNTSFASGCYSLPAGHLELGESVITALIREAREEIGICVEPEDVKFVQLMHNSYGIGRFAVFFEVKDWQGEVVNREPDKCDDLRWFPLADLPGTMVPYIRHAIDLYASGKEAGLTLYGW